MPCPVFANGDVRCVESARRIVATTGASGLMIGRGAIRNPWLFTQIREAWTTGNVTTQPTLPDLRDYIDRLDCETRLPGNLQTGTAYTPELADIEKVIRFTGAAAAVLTVALDTPALDFPIGTVLSVARDGAAA